MGFFTKDKPTDCYKKVNKLIKKMYFIKRTLILKAETITDRDREEICSKLNDAIYDYNDIVRMDFDGQYVLMKRDVWYGTSVIDYEEKRISINEMMEKVSKEIDSIKRITKGAPVLMSVVNPNSISKEFFYDEHKLGIVHTLYLNDPRFSIPPMFIV